MSTMLEQAIIDAEALKEAAIKNAEQVVVEKYQSEIKEAVETLLEQDPLEDDPMADPMADPMGEEVPETDEELAQQIPLGSTEGENLCPCPGEDEEIEIDFDQLAAQMKSEEEAEGGGAEMGGAGEFGSPLMEGEDEEIDLNEEDLLGILEELTLDMSPTQSGWLQRPTSQVEYEIDLLQAKTPTELDIEVDEEEPEKSAKDLPTKDLSESLSKAQHEIKKLKNTAAKRADENIKFKQILLQMKDTLNEVNLQNAKLLYTNEALNSNSLNKRQKKTIAEAIAKANSVQEAKTIFEALQSTVGQTSVSKRRAPKSLGEAVERRSLILPRRVEEEKSYNFSDRMKLLAGIN